MSLLYALTPEKRKMAKFTDTFSAVGAFWTPGGGERCEFGPLCIWKGVNILGFPYIPVNGFFEKILHCFCGPQFCKNDKCILVRRNLVTLGKVVPCVKPHPLSRKKGGCHCHILRYGVGKEPGRKVFVHIW